MNRIDNTQLKKEYKIIDVKRLYYISIVTSIFYFGALGFVVKHILRFFDLGNNYYIIGNSICFLIMTVLMVFELRDYLMAEFCDLKEYSVRNNLKWIVKGFFFYAIFYFLLMLPMTVLYSLLNQGVTVMPANQRDIQSLIESGRILSVLIVCFLAPFVEEILFRGLIYRSSRTVFNVPVSLFISSFLFAAVHMRTEMQTCDWDMLWIGLARYLAPGLAFGFLYEKRKNILTCIFLHSLLNAIAVLVFFIRLSNMETGGL